jgi:hypothetical protein
MEWNSNNRIQFKSVLCSITIQFTKLGIDKLMQFQSRSIYTISD